MKKIIRNIMMLFVALGIVSCTDNSFDLNYNAPVTIGFAGIDDTNTVLVNKGTLSYTAKIEVKASSATIKNFALYNADSKTGAKGTLIAGTSNVFDDGKGNGVALFSLDYIVDNLSQSKAIQVVVTDVSGSIFVRNLFVKISPTVVFSPLLKMETAEVYFGPYYASWMGGRIYMRQDGVNYKSEIDLSIGEVVIASEGIATVPALVNPALRANNNLQTIIGLQQTKFELTALTKAQYDAISQVDGTPISLLADPAQNAVKLVSGKVYLFKTANGKKGLLFLETLIQKTGTIENLAGEWKANTTYYQATFTTKILQQ